MHGHPAKARVPETHQGRVAKVPKKPLTKAEFDQHLLSIGLMRQLPDTDADFDMILMTNQSPLKANLSPSRHVCDRR